MDIDEQRSVTLDRENLYSTDFNFLFLISYFRSVDIDGYRWTWVDIVERR